MNNKDIILNELCRLKQYTIKDLDKSETQKKNLIYSYNLIFKLVEQRFDNILKLYNNGVDDKAWDKFSVHKILNDTSLYVEEFYLIDKEEKYYYFLIRKQMRVIVHLLWDFVNKNIK